MSISDGASCKRQHRWGNNRSNRNIVGIYIDGAVKGAAREY
jgi:hypothetical protein